MVMYGCLRLLVVMLSLRVLSLSPPPVGWLWGGACGLFAWLPAPFEGSSVLAGGGGEGDAIGGGGGRGPGPMDVATVLQEL